MSTPKITRVLISKLATLAHLSIDEDQIDRFGGQLSDILGYIDRLNRVDTEGIEAISHITGKTLEAREDISTSSFTLKQALANAKNTEKNMFEVANVFGEIE
ncbi:MAG: Asp-tRNA(Asn)/Glu-tRNA(Gln) amidotransferase subunit GatC [Candidatus Roizmanbacteria bacterium]